MADLTLDAGRVEATSSAADTAKRREARIAILLSAPALLLLLFFVVQQLVIDVFEHNRQLLLSYCHRSFAELFCLFAVAVLSPLRRLFQKLLVVLSE